MDPWRQNTQIRREGVFQEDRLFPQSRMLSERRHLLIRKENRVGNDTHARVKVEASAVPVHRPGSAAIPDLLLTSENGPDLIQAIK